MRYAIFSISFVWRKIKTTKGQTKTLECDWYVSYLNCDDDNIHIHISKITKLHVLIICSLLYTNYTLIKLHVSETYSNSHNNLFENINKN